jgi:hypothetical protein
MSTTSKLTGRGPLPLIISVTGHRDLRPEDLPTLEGLVRTIVAETAARYPHSPLVVLSPLAEGADRLVARVGLAQGARLIVPLPLPRDLYEQDFDTEESRAEFRALIDAAESVFELPVMDGNTLDSIGQPGEPRNRQYAQVGAFVARHSQVFFALWDGVTLGLDDKHGGTAEIVRFRLEGAPGRYDPAASPLTMASSGTVHHVITPRRGAPVPANALTHHLLQPPGETHGAHDEPEDLARWMDQFNADALAHEPALRTARETSKSWLLQVDVKDVPAQVASLTTSARITLEQYAVADSLAVIFAGAARGAVKLVYVWVFIAALFFNLFHSLPHHALPAEATLADRIGAVPWLLWLSFAASLVGSMWVHRRAAKEDHQNKHQDYRALAEALRIQFFWRVAGLPDAVVDHYLRKQRGELEWIRNALRAWDAESMRHHAREEQAPPVSARLAFVAKNWVAEQRNYYAKRARREHAKLESEEHKVELLVKCSVGLALLLALVLTVPLFVHVHALEAVMHAVENPLTHGLIMVAIVTLAVTAGLRHGFDEQMAYSEHAKQFGRMSGLFDSAERHLANLLKSGEHQHAAELLKEVGAEALEENGDWVLLHRERPLEVPHSG